MRRELLGRRAPRKAFGPCARSRAFDLQRFEAGFLQVLVHRAGVAFAEQARRDGVRDLRQAGLLKVRNGVTTLEEVISVTNQ